LAGCAEAEASAAGVAEHTEDEGEVIDEVAFSEPFGFLGEAVGPFESAALDPDWGAVYLSGDEAEADADAEPPGVGESEAEAVDNVFLFGRAEGDIDDVGMGGEEGLAEVFDGGGVAFEAHGWAEGAGDGEAGVFGLEDLGGVIGGSGIAAEEEEGAVGLRGGGAETPDEVGAGDAFGEGCALHAGGPDEGHAVGDVEGGGLAEGGEGGAFDESAEDIDVDGDDPSAAAGVEFVGDVAYALGFGESMEAYTA